MNYYNLIIGVALFLAQVGCSSTQTTTTWNKNNASIKQEKVAVLAVIGKSSVQRSYENEIVSRLQKEGVRAVAAYTLIPPSRKQPKVDQMIRRLYSEGVDMVMTVSLSDVSRSRTYVRGSTYVQPRTRYNRFGDYYVRSYRRVYTPGYYRKSTTVYLESNLYQLKNQELVWASESKSTDPGSLEYASKSYAKSVVKALNL